MNWDDARIFLALVRAGSVRAAASKSGVSHSTVARRVDALEVRLGVRLFDRLPSGYALTAAGEDFVTVAENIENQLDGVQRRLVGQDRRLAGVVRLTMADVVATHLLMPDLKRFGDMYPRTEFEIVLSYEVLDLGRREADVAIRFSRNPPEHLIGHKLAGVASGAYATASYLDEHDLEDPGATAWIGFGRGASSTSPQWIKQSPFPLLPAKGSFDSISVQLEAARCGMGIANLPCFVGDRDPLLRRVVPETSPANYDLWLLRHRDTRATARLRVFSEFIREAIVEYRALLAGECGGQ